MKKKILIVDDSLFIRKALREILCKKYKIVQADTGNKAIKKFKEEKPDLTLLDIVMPESEEEGLRVLKTIMKNKPKSKVIMITAVGHNLMIKTCKKLGAKDYIVKPFDEEQVVKTSERYLS